ncbi:MAG: fibronectin type III-like domain-contianing protein, partial [Clostridia bacterium]|nr:fibronectin type III-like domain-contianing protein [Clostridia bacterium]
TAFTEKCAAVLYTCRSGQGVTQAALDILTGAVSPSGKLTDSFPLSLNGFGASGVRYPFGYGLSYTSFSYRNLKITEQGVSCTVENTGGCDGFVTVQLYARKEGSATTLGYSLLRGFSKVYVKKNDAVRVEIPFDGNTFRTYDPDKRRYRIEGGNYDIFVGDDVNTVRLKGELTLAGHVYRDDVYKNEPLPQTDPVGFTDTPLEKRIRREKKKLSFGVKLFLAIVLALYYDAVGAVLMFTNVVADKETVFYIVIGVLLLLGNAVAAIYIAVIANRRKYQRYLHPNDVLTDLVDKVECFDEIARVSYEKPVPVPETEFLEEEEPETETSVPVETEEA